MEKLISLNEQCWHYRLIRFVWDFNPKEFRNLCPYFWLTIASLFVVPFVAIYKGIKFVFLYIVNAIGTLLDKISDLIDKKNYNDRVYKLSNEDIYFLKHRKESDNDLIQRAKSLGRFQALTLFAEKYFDKIEDALINLTENFDDDKVESAFATELERLFAIKKKKEKQYYDKIAKEQEAEARMRKRMHKIASFAHDIGIFVYALSILFVVFFFNTAFTDFFVWILNLYVNWVGIWEVIKLFIVIAIIACIMAAIVTSILHYGSKWIKADKKWYYWPVIALYYPLYLIVGVIICEYFIYKFCYQIVIYTVLWGILRGIGVGFREFGGIFADYFDASYSDYCPGINWEN